jgi:hypothetical protein
MAQPAQRLDTPRRLLVVLDLNGTLLIRPNSRRPTEFLMRPHAREFLQYCSETFALVVWSSAKPENVEAMYRKLTQVAKKKRNPQNNKKNPQNDTPPCPTTTTITTPQEAAATAVAVWARDRFNLAEAEYNSRVQVYKRLTRVWTDPVIARAHPDADAGGAWDQTNTVLIDDSFEKAREQPHNLLEIPEFTGLDDGNRLDVLPQVHDYLNTLAQHDDVSRFLYRLPFSLRSPTNAAMPPPGSPSGGEGW